MQLDANTITIIDGGTGTDIQRRGVPMSSEAWCAEANRTHPDIVRDVHRDYIAAGARMITANNYPTSPLLFDALGRLDEVAELDGLAIQLAREASAGRVAVGSSFSVMRPTVSGGDRTQDVHWTERRARELMEIKADGIQRARPDVVVMEMMRDSTYSKWAVEAAVATGLPVWVGIAVERAETGGLQGFGRIDMRADDFIPDLLSVPGIAAVAVMHTAPPEIADALTLIRRTWDGPLGAYPESGYFTMPDWQFVDIIEPEALCRFAHEWVDLGATFLGGCCGTGPDHIAALAREFTP